MTAPAIEGFRLSPRQELLWRSAPEGPPALRALYRLDGPLDRGRLEAALGVLAARHEPLRTAFRRLPGMALPVQVPLPPGTAPARLERVLDLTALDAAGREAAAEAFWRRSRPPLDLAAGEAVRWTLARLAPERHLLLAEVSAACADGRSLATLLAELAAAYEGGGVGGEETEPPVQYADFVEWQSGLLGADAAAEGLEYWRGRRAAAARRAGAEADGGQETAAGEDPAPGTVTAGERPLPPELLEAVERLGGAAGAEAAGAEVVFAAAWAALLWRRAGGDGVAFDWWADGRKYEELGDSVGPFAVPLPSPFAASAGISFGRLLDQARELAAGGAEWQEYAGAGEPGGDDAAAGSGFELVCDRLPAPCSAGGLTLSLERRCGGAAPGGLRLAVELGEGGGWARLEGSGVEEAAAVLLLEGWLALVTAAVARPVSRLGALPVVGEAEQRLVVEEWNRTEQAPPAGSPATVDRLIGEQAALRPDAAAVVAGSDHLSYGGLWRRAGAWAARLLELGLEPEERVGLVLGRGGEQVAAALGVLRAGGAFVALDLGQPEARLASMLEQAGVRRVVVEPGARVPAGSWAPVPWPAAGSMAGLPGAAEPPGPPSPRGLAYGVFTSGSTGSPKGVLIEHASAVNLVHALEAAVYRDRGPELRVSLNAPLSFDAAVKQLVQLGRGRTLWVVPEEVRADGEAFAGWLVRRGVEALDCTPSQLRLLVDAGWQGPGLVLAGGEALPEALAARLASTPGLEAFNVYGPSECTVDASAWRVTGEAVSLGSALGNVRLYVVDRELSPVPLGMAGELAIGGAGVGRGYARRPGETAARFVPDPFAAVPGGRLYRTGDKVRREAGGELRWLGRLDGQVKLRGFRIEVGEIEAVLAAHPAVDQAAVALRADAPGVERLVAYAVPLPGAALDPVELRDWLARRLPAPMVPAALVELPALPLTANGKLDRRALPAPPAEEAGAGAAPDGPVEEVVAGIWRELLGRPRVPADRSFFDLGGHSLLATQLMARVRRAFRVELPLRDLFEAPTVAGLARRVAAAGERPRPLPPPVAPVPPGGDHPLSAGQRRLWLIDQIEGSGHFYTRWHLRLDGRLEPAALAAAVTAIARRHEVLRTVLAVRGGEPRQVVLPPAPVPLPRIDLAALPAGRRGAEAARLSAAEGRRPFDLARGPLLRLLLARCSAAEHRLLMTLHHVVTDAWSMRVMVEELAALYGAALERRPSPLAPPPVQYGAYARWQAERLRGPVLDELLGFWRSRLAGAAPLLDLPLDRPRTAVERHRGGLLGFPLAAAETAALDRVCGERDVTRFMALLAAFQALLHRYTGQTDLVLGTPVANRGQLEVEGLIGFFINTVVLRTDLAGDPSFGELLERVREVTIAALGHQELPFERLVEELQPERTLGRQLLFHVMYVHQTAGRDEVRLPGLTLTPLETEARHAKNDLTLGMVESPDGIAGVVEYRSDLFDRTTMRRLAGHFRTLLAAALEDPGRPLSALPLLAPAERHQVTVEWNRSRPGRTRPLFHQAFAARAAAEPDRPALIAAGGVLSYGELDRRSDRFAAALARRGAGPERTVGLCLDRGAEMVIAILGVLKAGAAYLPLDPEYPPERLGFMLGDAETALLVASARHAGLLSGRPGLATWESLAGELTSGAPPAAPRREPEPDHLAYVIYTSGSTGLPKAVPVTHRGLANLVREQELLLALPAGSRVLQMYSFGFDASIWDLLMALPRGGALVIAAGAERLPGPEQAALVRRHQVDVAVFPPSALSALPAAELPGIETVISTGEACTAELVDRWAPGRRFFNGYGPTEVTLGVSMARCRAGERKPSIGRPFAGMEVHVLDPRLRRVPAGVVGEIHVGGLGLARGYHRRPALTAGRFVPHPYADRPGRRLYRTGDLGRLRADGSLEFVGRLDGQVKVRGFRVELGEVEAELRRHPGLRAAAVAVRGEGGAARLVAYAVPAAGAAVEVAGLREFLRRRLPPYLLPGAWVILDDLPLTPNGKVDRDALPEPAASGRDHLGVPYAPPRSPAEERLAAIWEEVLGVTPVGVDDDFFLLGGHSLLATRLVGRVRQAFAVEVGLAELFQRPTVAGLAAEVERLALAGAAPDRLDALLDRLEEMPDAAVRELLEGRGLPSLVPEEVE